MALHNEIGKIGEEIACKYLKNKDYVVIDRNYSQYYGEIDIVCTKGGKTYFIEVKTVTRENFVIKEKFRPEENMHPKKLERLYKTIEIYLSEKKIKGEWGLYLVTVRYSPSQKKAKVEMIPVVFN